MFGRAGLLVGLPWGLAPSAVGLWPACWSGAWCSGSVLAALALSGSSRFSVPATSQEPFFNFSVRYPPIYCGRHRSWVSHGALTLPLLTYTSKGSYPVEPGRTVKVAVPPRRRYSFWIEDQSLIALSLAACVGVAKETVLINDTLKFQD